MSIIRHRFLSIAFTITLFIINNNPLVLVVILLGSCIYHWQFMKCYTFYLFLFLILFLYLHQSHVEIMDHHTLRIEEIRNNYTIASNGKNKCILYNVKGVSLYDIIEVKGEYKEVSSNKNRNTFQFDTYLKRKNIYSSMYVTSYKTITKSKHMKAKLYNHIDAIKNESIKVYMQKVFYRIEEDKHEYSYFIYASGLHVSYLILLLSKTFKINYHITGLVFSFAMMMLFPIAAYMHRIFFFSLIPLLFTKLHKREQLGISMIALYWVNASIVYEISFIIPVAFRLISCFDVSKVAMKLKQFLVLIPIQLSFFHELNLISLICFPIMRMISSILFLFSILALILNGLFPILSILIQVQEYFIAFLSSSYKIIGKPYLLWIILWVVVSIQYITYKQSKQAIILVLLLLFQWNMKLLTPFGEITYIDVGQGDCILIREPSNGEVMLIDVAGKINQNIPEAIIYPVLKAKGIHHIDKIVITHDDYDHHGGFDDLKKLILVKEVIYDKQDIHLKHLRFNAFQRENAKDENDKSIILYSHINKLNYLFMGDASVQVEKEFIDLYNKLEIDILKAGHHGSRTSSSLSFIHQIRPMITVISSGRNNLYNHPHDEVIDLLAKENSAVMNTQMQGSISIYFHPFFNVLVNGDNSVAFLP